MRQYSAKRQAEIPIRKRVVAAVHARDQFCRVHPRVTAVPCGGGYPLHVHEIIPRDAWRLGYLVISNCILACPFGHDWITNHPKEAAELGLHGWSWEIPTEFEVAS